jgi:hypothetical protein
MKVRVGGVYTFEPVPMDQSAAHLRHVEPGLFVRVINPPGCPRANTMGHCFIESAVTNEFIGLVCCNSLKPLNKKERRTLVRQRTTKK